MPPQASDSNEDIAISARLTIWPNPNDGELLYVAIPDLATDAITTNVDIYEATGQRVIARTLAVQDGHVNTSIRLDEELAPGLYMVIFTAGEVSFTQRLSVQ